MIRWRGEPDPRHVKAVDAYWVSAAEHGMNASTFTARVISASTGARTRPRRASGAVGAMSRPLHTVVRRRARRTWSKGWKRTGDADAYTSSPATRLGATGSWGSGTWRGTGLEDPRARVPRRTAKELGAPRYEVALALENAALAELHARRPDRVLATNVEFWAAIVLRLRRGPGQPVYFDVHLRPHRGVSAHILEQSAHRQADPAQRLVRRPGGPPGPRGTRCRQRARQAVAHTGDYASPGVRGLARDARRCPGPRVPRFGPRGREAATRAAWASDRPRIG